jgi:hypothetical protein
MMTAARLLSWLALAGTIAPSILFFAGQATLDHTKFWMLASTVIWFATAPVWTDRKQDG